MTKTRWIILLSAAALLVAVAPSVGPRWIPPFAFFSGDESSHLLYRELRLPRVLLGLLVGGALSIAGVAFQGLFRNALASPFTLGVSGGAAVGAALSFYLGLQGGAFGIKTSALFALVGALGTAALVWSFAARRRSPGLTILLCGVVLSFFYSSVIMLFQYLGDFGEVFRLTHWMLGSLEVVGFSDLIAMLPFVTAGSALLLYDASALNLLSLGEELAQSRGVAVRRAHLRILLGVSLIIGAVVSVCGPIGFVGIIVPFFCRVLVGYEHRTLLPASMVIGGIFLVLCDTVSRTIFSPLELPVGVCTALIGGPAFLWILLRGDRFKGSIL